VGCFEDLTFEILLPDVKNWKPELKTLVNEMAKWVRSGS
jgi:hypothetical protein